MGKERTKDFYNKKIDLAFKSYELSPWKQLYDCVVSLLPPEKDINILDLGCGSGRLCKALNINGYYNYLGVDFADKLIIEAKRYNNKSMFSVVNFFDSNFQKTFVNYDIFLISEVLEHLNKDLDLVASLPSGKNIIYSVPNFDSAGHVRWFNNVEEVLDRYSIFIKHNYYETLVYKHNPKLKAFIMKGKIK